MAPVRGLIDAAFPAYINNVGIGTKPRRFVEAWNAGNPECHHVQNPETDGFWILRAREIRKAMDSGFSEVAKFRNCGILDFDRALNSRIAGFWVLSAL